MPTFIKTGFWEKTSKSYQHWLNLDALITQIAPGGSGGVVPNNPITPGTNTKISYDAKGLVTTGSQAALADLGADSTHRTVSDSQIATWNALIGGSIFQTTWNASTNSPTITSSVGTRGYYYIVSVAGTTNINGINDWQVGDWIIFDGTVWRKVDNTDSVSSVNGLLGAVNLDTSNVSDTVDKRYQTDNQKTFNDATSSIQTQLNNKLNTASPAYTGKLSTSGGIISTTTSGSLIDLAQTWQNNSSIITGIKLNVTDTVGNPSNSTSLLMDLQVGGVTKFNINKNGDVFVNGSISSSGNVKQNVWESAGVNAASTLRFRGKNSVGLTPKGLVIENNGNFNKIINTSGQFDMVSSPVTFDPTSGTGTFNLYTVENTINQTGGASGITRGLYVNPTLTSAFDFRGIEVVKGSIVLPYATASGTYVVKTSDYLVNFTSGSFTATLPTAVGCTGKTYILKNTGAGTITLATTSSQTIDGTTPPSLAQNKYIQVVSTGANWIITGNN